MRVSAIGSLLAVTLASQLVFAPAAADIFVWFHINPSLALNLGAEDGVLAPWTWAGSETSQYPGFDNNYPVFGSVTSGPTSFPGGSIQETEGVNWFLTGAHFELANFSMTASAEVTFSQTINLPTGIPGYGGAALTFGGDAFQVIDVPNNNLAFHSASAGFRVEFLNSSSVVIGSPVEVFDSFTGYGPEYLTASVGPIAVPRQATAIRFKPTARINFFSGDISNQKIVDWRVGFDNLSFDLTLFLPRQTILPLGWEPADPPVFQLIDTDSDGISDDEDNCTRAANADQRDTDFDFIGNACDADITGDCVVNFLDAAAYRANFFMPGDLDTDNNGDNLTNFIDLQVLREQFFGPPGPSAAGCN